MIVTAVCSGKGGTGKTFATMSIATELSLLGSKAKKKPRILIVDLDPSKNGSKLQELVKNNDFSKSLGDLFQDPKLDPRSAIYQASEDFPGISVMISGESLEYVDRLIAKRHNTDYILKNILKKIEHDFDYAILDCPPNKGTLAANAIVACDAYITPLDFDMNAIDGALAMRRLVDYLLEEGVMTDRPIDLGAFWSRYPSQNSIARRTIASFAAEILSEALLDIKIPESTHVKEAIYATTTLQFDKNHKVSKAYSQLTSYIKSKINEAREGSL